ncbi:MAG: hypothetical protein K2L50_01385 [Bacteroidales bacterium]|nr:hypothetical protein [Bacteroidales bacterium]
MFRNIAGQRELIEKMIAAVDNGRIAHAQLFWGPEGNGQLALALAYAQYINCQHKMRASEGADLAGLSADSCGKCPSCLKFEKLAHPDLHFVYPNNINGSDIKKDSQSLDYIDVWRKTVLENQALFSYNEWVDAMGIGNRQAIINIRDCHRILQTLSLKPSEARYRVVVIWLIEKLSETIASTLLKTLEEPEPQTVFLLVSENPDQVLPTILSRTQMVKVPKVALSDMEKFLQGKGLDAAQAQALAPRCRGNLLEAKILSGNNEVRKNFHTCFTDWMRLCFKVDMPALVALSEKLSGWGREQLKFFLQNCLDEFRNCLLLTNACAHWTEGDAEEKSFWKNFSRYVTNTNIAQYYDLFNGAIYLISRNAHIPTLFTDMSIHLCRIIAAAQRDLQQQPAGTR